MGLDAPVVVVGGSIAGCALALHLDRAGIESLVLEQHATVHDKACGEGIMPTGVEALARLGLHPRAMARPFDGVSLHVEDRVAHGRFAPGVIGLGMRRPALVTLLQDAVRAAPHATLRTGARVRTLLRDGKAVLGVEAEEEGRRVAYRAAFTVAADGLHSPIARAAGWTLPVPGFDSQRFGAVIHLRGAVPPAERVEVWLDPGVGELYITPLHDDELLVALLADRRRLLSLEPYVTSGFMAYLQGNSPLAARLSRAVPSSLARGAGPLRRRVARVVGPGLALAGDAAGYLDPITGGGIAQALLDAEWLSGAIARQLRDGDAAALRAYPKQRARVQLAHGVLTHAMLQLAHHPRLASWAVAALAREPALLDRLLVLS